MNANTEIEQDRVAELVDWDDFRVFLEIVRAGSFNRAATKLQMTQPTVSRRMVRLEQTIGVKLFERDRRGPTLTAQGHRIFNDASVAQASLMRASNVGRNPPSLIEGDCRILMSDGLGCYWLARFLPAFLERHPNVELKIFGNSDGVAERRESFDLEFVFREPSASELVSAKIGTQHFVPFASCDYLEKYGMPQSVDDLAQHKLIDQTIYLSEAGVWAGWAQGDALSRVVLMSNTSPIVGESMRHGAGIALLPSYAALAHDNVMPINIGVQYRSPIYVTYPREVMRKWPVRATLDFLRSYVFNSKAMPWFRDSYVAPNDSWNRLLEESLKAAIGGVPAEAAQVKHVPTRP